jgi:hypothetical protein
MKTLWTALVALSIALSGCDHCYNVACDEPNVEQINALRFEFDRKSFTYEEVNSAHILRFQPGNLDQPLDTIFLKGKITPGDFSFILTPITNDRSTGEVTFVYGIYDNSHENAYIISDIVSRGIYPTDCCCCYRNTERTFLMNGEPVDRSGSMEAVLLTK